LVSLILGIENLHIHVSQQIDNVPVWTLIFKACPSSNREETSFTFSLQELAIVLETIYDGRRHRIKAWPAVVKEFISAYSDLEVHAKKSIKSQVPLLRFTRNGGDFVLDTSFVVPDARPQFEISICSSRLAVQPRSFQATADKSFQWLLSSCNLARADTHRFLFGLNDEGLLHCSKHFSTYLMIDTVAMVSNMKITDMDDQTQNSELCCLVTAKIANDEKGLEILRLEAKNLQNLQFTGRVAKLWDYENLEKVLDRGALLTVYHPTPLERDFEMCLRKEDIEMLAVEFLSTLDCLHQNGWIWNNLRTGHYLYNPLRQDDRDSPDSLQAIGLENAQFVGQAASTDSITAHIKEDGSECPSEISPGKGGDMHSLGLLLLSMCSRNPSIHSRHYLNGLNQDTMKEAIKAHNKLVFDQSKLLNNDDWIIMLVELLLREDPDQRPGAAEALLFARSQTRNNDTRLLVEGEVTEKFLPGYVDVPTRRFVWPVTVHSTVVKDVHHLRKKSKDTTFRLTKAVTVKASFDMPTGVIAARYSGRPILKRTATWLQIIELQTHSVSDGANGALDGRREGNGIFEQCYYESTVQVKSEYSHILFSP
jgi:hypothetical protein